MIFKSQRKRCQHLNPDFSSNVYVRYLLIFTSDYWLSGPFNALTWISRGIIFLNRGNPANPHSGINPVTEAVLRELTVVQLQPPPRVLSNSLWERTLGTRLVSIRAYRATLFLHFSFPPKIIQMKHFGGTFPE